MDKPNLLKSDYIKLLLIALLAVASYWNTIGHDFTWDDQLVIDRNTVTIQGLDGLREIWTSYAYLQDRPVYRPIPQTIHALIWEVSPNNPKLHHLTNILFYTLCCVSFLLVLKLYFKKTNPWILFFIALVFTLHPIHTEVVANNKSLDEILSLFFVLLSLGFYSNRTRPNLIYSAFFFILALLSKISAITILPLFLIPWLSKQEALGDKIIGLSKKYINWYALASILLMVLYAYLQKFHFNRYNLNLLYVAGFLALLINNQRLRGVLVVMLSIGLSLNMRWEFAILLFLLHIASKLPTSKKAWLEVILETIALLSITILLGQNAIPQSLLVVGFIFINYQFKARDFKYKKPFWISLSLFFIAFFVLGLFESTVKIIFLYYIAITAILILYPNISRYKKLLLLILFVPMLELYSYPNYYKLQSSEIEKTNVVETNNYVVLDESVKSPIAPYHNVLVLAKNRSEKFTTISRIQLLYLEKLFAPNHLIHQYGTWQVKLATWKNWDVYLSIAVHLLLLFLAYYFFTKKWRITALGIVWYFITISIYTNIIQLLPDTLAERFLFLPSVGFSIAFVTGLYFLMRQVVKEEQKSVVALGLLLLPLMGYYTFKTIDRNKDWESNYLLAANTLPFAPDNAAINAQYASELNNLIKYNVIADSDSARQLILQHYDKALALFPNFYGPNADLANYYILQATPEKAYPYLKESLRMKPDEWIHHYYLALIYYDRNNYIEAISHFDFLIQDKTLIARAFEFPELLEAYEYKARCLHNTGKDPEAYAILEEAIGIYQQKSTFILLANLYRVTGKTNLAIETFQKLNALYPGDQELINTITYLKQGKIY